GCTSPPIGRREQAARANFARRSTGVPRQSPACSNGPQSLHAAGGGHRGAFPAAAERGAAPGGAGLVFAEMTGPAERRSVVCRPSIGRSDTSMENNTLIERLDEMLPGIRAQREEIERGRRLPQELVQRLTRTGL